MTTTQWLLGFHLVGAFLFIAGGFAVGALYTAASRQERPSEVAFLLGLNRIAVALVGAGGLLAFGFGAWLVEETGTDWGTSWIGAAIVFWVVAMALGGIGGRSARHARYLAERLAADGDAPTDELRRALTDPLAWALNLASFLATLVVLALMVWKP